MPTEGIFQSTKPPKQPRPYKDVPNVYTPRRGQSQVGTKNQVEPEWDSYRNAPLVIGALAAFFAGAIAFVVANNKEQSIQEVAERVYREECSALRTPGVEWCAGGVELGKQLITPFWAESPLITALVTAVIAFVVVLLAVQSLQRR